MEEDQVRGEGLAMALPARSADRTRQLMAAHKSMLGRKQEETIAALLTQRNLDEAAKAAGISPHVPIRIIPCLFCKLESDPCHCVYRCRLLLKGRSSDSDLNRFASPQPDASCEGLDFGELKPIKKFTDRKVAVARIWQAIQRLNADGAADSVPEPATEIPLEVATEIEPVAEVASIPEVIEAAAVAAVAQQVPDVAPEVAAAKTDASPTENAPAAVAEAAAVEQTTAKQPKRKKATKPAQGKF